MRFNIAITTAKGFIVDATPRVEAGIYAEGRLHGPDLAQVRQGLPYRLRKAFDREAAPFWLNEQTGQFVCHLKGVRGKPLASIYANVRCETF